MPLEDGEGGSSQYWRSVTLDEFRKHLYDLGKRIICKFSFTDVTMSVPLNTSLSATVGVHLAVVIAALSSATPDSILSSLALSSTALHNIMTCRVYRLLRFSSDWEEEADSLTPVAFNYSLELRRVGSV